MSHHAEESDCDAWNAGHGAPLGETPQDRLTGGGGVHSTAAPRANCAPGRATSARQAAWKTLLLQLQLNQHCWLQTPLLLALGCLGNRRRGLALGGSCTRLRAGERNRNKSGTFILTSLSVLGADLPELFPAKYLSERILNNAFVEH